MYTLQQQAFALAMAASADYTEKGSVSQLETDLATALTNLYSADPCLGTWSTVWGPVVYQGSFSDVEDNAMFVAQGSDAAGNPVYVVSVAGTNPESVFVDLLTEDLDTTLTAWPYGAPSGLSPNVSKGTLDGLGYLLAMQDPSTQQSLSAYLQGVQGSSATVIITGHSLGGALSPALGLALFGGPSAALDAASWGGAYVFPIAGPTVGDQDYATFFADTFPVTTDSEGNTWNQLAWNTLDVVPLAWNQLSGLGTLYPSLTGSPCLTSVQQGLAGLGGSSYVQLQNQSYTGAFVAPTVQLNPVSAFLTEAFYQHVWAYFDLLGVPGLRAILGVTDPLTDPPSALGDLCTYLTGSYCSAQQRQNQCGSASSSVDLTSVTIGRPASVQG